jgi:hypothetical protein
MMQWEHSNSVGSFVAETKRSASPINGVTPKYNRSVCGIWFKLRPDMESVKTVHVFSSTGPIITGVPSALYGIFALVAIAANTTKITQQVTLNIVFCATCQTTDTTAKRRTAN